MVEKKRIMLLLLLLLLEVEEEETLTHIGRGSGCEGCGGCGGGGGGSMARRAATRQQRACFALAHRWWFGVEREIGRAGQARLLLCKNENCTRECVRCLDCE